MANTGKGAAFLQLRPLQNTAGQDAKYWAEDSFRQKQEERIAENQRTSREASAEKERNDRKDKYMKFVKPYDTKSKSMNEVVARNILNANEMIGEVANRLVSGDFKDMEEEASLRVLYANLQQVPEKMKMVTDVSTARYNEVQKLKKSGAIKINDNLLNYEKLFESGAEKFEGIIDENGNPGIMYRDLDGDGVMDFEGFEEISQGLSAFKFDKNYDIDKLATSLVSGIGTKKTVTDDSYLKKTVEGPDPDALEFATYAAMIDRDGDLTEAGTSFMQDLDFEDTMENRDKMMEEWKKIVDSKVSYKEEEDFDYGARTAAAREARIASGEEESKPTAPAFEPIPVSEETWGGSKLFNNIDRDKVNSVSGGGTTIESLKDVVSGKTYNDAKVLNYTYDRKGNILFDIEYVNPQKEVRKVTDGVAYENSTTTTASNVTSRAIVQGSPEDARELANKNNITLEELKKRAQKSTTAQKPTENDPLGLGLNLE